MQLQVYGYGEVDIEKVSQRLRHSDFWAFFLGCAEWLPRSKDGRKKDYREFFSRESLWHQSFNSGVFLQRNFSIMATVLLPP
jgi:hypothetical protein